MNVNPNEYVVLKRSELKDLLGAFFASVRETTVTADEWIFAAEVPLMTLPQIEKDVIDNSQKWFPEAFKNGVDITLATLGIAGEAGEVADVLKKRLRGSLGDKEFRDRIVEETIDLLHYMCMIWVAFQVDVSEVYRWKSEINEKRFGPKED